MSTGKDARGGNQTDGGDLIEREFSLKEYNMNHSRRGMAHIFNQKNFDEHKGANNTMCRLNTRHGTDADRDNLRDRLKELNFDVKHHDNLTKEAVLTEIRKAADADHVDADCFCCVFLSHGEKDKIHARDGKISIQEVTALFKGDQCRSLVGKPKIFIFQACRGKECDLPVTGMCAESSDEEEENNQVVEEVGVVQTLPAGADFLMCYSVAEGYVSFRNSILGSWYVQDLCKTLEKCSGSFEFTELLTLVNSKVSTRSAKSDDKELDGKKQVPCFVSMLTKKLYFGPKQ